MKREDPERPWVKQMGLLAVITADVLGYTGAGLGLGYLAWQELGFPWWIVLITTMTGLSLAMYRVYQISQRVWK